MAVNAETGGLLSLLSMSDGKLDGQALTFAEDGRLRESVTWVDGVPQGSLFKWDEDGRLQERGFYEDGELVGPPARADAAERTPTDCVD